MQFTLKASIVFTVAFSLNPALSHAQGKQAEAAAAGAMPVAQQNALVQKYCAVCHSDAHRNGGLTLQHFDASRVEPSLAAMMASKLKSGALGAAGIGVPDRATEDGLLKALLAKSEGANEWTLTRSQDPATQASVVSSSIVRELPSPADPRTVQLYRLKLSCRMDTHEAEMQLTWSPQPANSGRTISVAVDGKVPVTFTVEGREKMGNGAKTTDGADVTSGPAAAVLYATRPNSRGANLAMPLPTRTLSVSNLFPDETVVFPFDTLTPTMRRELSTCFDRSSASR